MYRSLVSRMSRGEKETGEPADKRRKLNVPVPGGKKKKKPAIIATKRRSVEDKLLQAGERNKPGSFIDEFQTEARIAAYLGYENIADLRHFVLSHYFLDYFNRFPGPWSKNMRKNPAFAQIRDRLSKSTFVYYPLTSRGLGTYCQETFSKEEESNRAHYMAHILIVMVHTLGKSDGEEKIVEVKGQDCQTAKLKLLRPFCRAIPDIKSKAVRFPVLKPACEESDLEPYNRVWNLLRYFMHVTSTENLWSTKFEHRDWDIEKIVTDSYVPTWMRHDAQGTRTTDSVEAACQTSPPRNTKHVVTMVQTVLPRIPIRLYWKRKGGVEAARVALEAFIRENKVLDYPDSIEVCRIDPRTLSRERFLDGIRSQYRLDKSQLQLSSVQMRIPPADIENDDDEEKSFNIFTCDWSILREVLESTFATDDPGSKAIDVDVRLRVPKTKSRRDDDYDCDDEEVL